MLLIEAKVVYRSDASLGKSSWQKTSGLDRLDQGAGRSFPANAIDRSFFFNPHHAINNRA
jgi:hypothetical protein